MKWICAASGVEFTVTDADQDFYQKIGVPIPTLCPDERQRAKMLFRNERNLHRRRCDLCEKAIIAMYREDVPFPVYCQQCWWGDGWDQRDYGLDFDPHRSFFEQFAELMRVIPRVALINSKSENSEYTNYSERLKNCFLLVGSGECEDCLYGYRLFRCRDVCEGSFLVDSELCYECLEGEHLYDCQWCQKCSHSRNLISCFDCRSCEHCYGCTNLVNKKFHIFNEPLSEEEYFKTVEAHCNAPLRRGWDIVRDIQQTALLRANKVLQCERCTGDDLVKCKQCNDCFDLSECEDCHHCFAGVRSRDCTDSIFFDNCELCVDSTCLDTDHTVCFSFLVWYCQNVSYSMECFYSHDLFGCLGFRKGEYCILNKQYGKEEYFALREKVLQHMRESPSLTLPLRERGQMEYGHFFPGALSPFGYNETIAQSYFPMTRAAVLERGWPWHDDDASRDGMDRVSTDEDLLTCNETGRPFKVQPLEQTLLDKMNLQPSELCPEIRFQRRMGLRNPRKLIQAQCSQCNDQVQTTSSVTNANLMCEQCYLAVVQ